MTLSVITASRLRDGAIVWLTADHVWSTRFAEAQCLAGDVVEHGLAVAGAAARAQLIVGAYQVEVSETPSGVLPVSVRERIRATGPSVRPDFAYALVGE
jgi:sulfite reductase (NADPH) hemoprotein beta-component